MFFDKDGSEMWCGHEHQLQTWFREIKIVQHCTSFQHSFRGYWMILCDIFNHPDWLHPQFDLYHFKTEKGSNWSQVSLKLVTSWSAENQVTSGSSQSKITNLNYICITNLTLKSFIASSGWGMGVGGAAAQISWLFFTRALIFSREGSRKIGSFRNNS